MSTNSHEQIIKEIGSMTVVQLNELVKAIEETFGVSAAAMTSAAPAAEAGAAAKAEEKAEYKVKLVDAGSQKIQVIKALKAASALSLSEAKEKVDGAPTDLGVLPKADAEKLKAELEKAGAKVELS